MSNEKATEETSLQNFLDQLEARQLTSDAMVEELLLDQRIRLEARESTRVEDYFRKFPELANDSQLAVDLIYNEFLILQELGSGESSGIESWLARFPAHASALKRQFDVYETMSLVEDESPSEPRFKKTLQALLGPRFQLREKLGSGSFAEVYRAWDEELKRDVAIKFARRSMADEAIELERFKREAEAAAKLTHPGVVAIYEVGPNDNRPFIVQEYVSGGTLKSRIVDGRYSYQEAAQWTMQIAEAIDYAHSFGVVHRDVKPANILFAVGARLKVADFGLASLADQESQLTRHGEVLGTPAYMSPEQAAGELVGTHSDVYSIGVVLFELLNGHPPFVGSASKVLNQVAHQDPEFTRKFVPSSLQSICLKAMSKQPRDRYATARELAMDLGRYLHGEPVQARPLSIWQKSLRWMANQPALIATLLSALFILLALGSYSFWRIEGERQRFREQRDIANERLLESLLNSATTSLRSKHSGWYESTMSDLKKVSEHPHAGRKIRVLQELIAEAVCDNSMRVQPENEWRVAEGQVICCLEKAEGDLLLAGLDNGLVLGIDASMGERLFRLSGPLTKVEKLASWRGHVWGLAGGELWEWVLPNFNSIVAQRDANRPPFRIAGEVCGATTNFALIPKLDEVAVAMARNDGRILLKSLGSENEKLLDVQSSRPPVMMMANDDGTQLLLGFDDHRVHWFDLSREKVTQACRLHDPIVDAVIHDDLGVTMWTTKVSYRTESMTNNQIRSSIGYRGAPVCLTPLGDNVIVGNDDGMVVVSSWYHSVLTKWQLEAGLSCAAADANGSFFWVGDDEGKITKLQLVKNRVKRPFFTIHGIDVDESSVWSDARRISLDTPVVRTVGYTEVTKMVIRGKDLLVGTLQGEVFVKELGGNERQRVAHHSHPVAHVSFHGDRVVSMDTNGQYSCCQLNSRQQQFAGELVGGTIQDSAATSERVYVLSNGQLHCLDLTTEKMFSTAVDCKTGGHVAADGAWLVVGDGRSVRLLNSDFDLMSQFELQEPVLDLGVSQSGGRLMVLTRSGCHEYRLRPDQATVECELVRTYQVENGLAVYLNESLKRLLVMDTDFSIYLFQFEHLNPQASLNTKSAARHEMACLESGDLLIGSRGVIRLDGRQIQDLIEARPSEDVGAEIPLEFQFEVEGDSWAARWSVDIRPDGEMVAVGRHYGKIEIIDPEDMTLSRILDNFETEVWRVAFSPDSKQLVAASEKLDPISQEPKSGLLTMFEVETWKKKFEVEIGKRLIAGVSFHPTEPMLAVSSFDGGVWLVATETGEVRKTLVPSQPEGRRNSLATMDVQFSPDGRWLAAVCKTQGVLVWKIDPRESIDSAAWATRYREVPVPGQRLWALAFDSTSQRLVTASEFGQIDVFQVGEFRNLLALRPGLIRLRNICFSPDNRYLVMSAWTNYGAILDLKELDAQFDKFMNRIEARRGFEPIFPKRN